MKKCIHWSLAEVTLLKELYPKTRVKDLATKFPLRNKATIVAKAIDLGLPSAKLWKPYEDKILKVHFIDATIKELCQLLPGRSKLAILARGERLGFKRKRNKPRLQINEDYFKKWSQTMAYILGFILADGCIVKGTYQGYSDTLTFGVQKGDMDILHKIKQELGADHMVSIGKNAAYFSVASQRIVNDLKALGISHRKSLREHLPNVPVDYIRDFIRGLIDGDGGISLDSKRINYPTLRYCGGEKIVTFVRDYFYKKFGLHSTVYKRPSVTNQGLYLASITYRGNSAKKLIDYLYRDAALFLDRKYELALRCLQHDIKPRINYTPEENTVILKNYPALTREKLLILLPGRSWWAIQEQARTLGLYRYKHLHNNTLTTTPSGRS